MFIFITQSIRLEGKIAVESLKTMNIFFLYTGWNSPHHFKISSKTEDKTFASKQ